MTFMLYREVMPSSDTPSPPNGGLETSAVWLRAARHAAGLTQAELAQRLGVDQSQVA